MITVHYLNNSRAQRVIWLLEELEVPYEVKRYERDPKTIRAPATLKTVHALGKSPVITDGNATIAESGAIVEYLVRRYGEGKLAPDLLSPAYNDYVYWLHFAEGSLMPPLVMRLVFEKIKSSPMPFFIKPVARMLSDMVMRTYLGPEIVSALRFIDAYLADRDWFAGNRFSAADVQMSFPLEASVARDLVHEGNYPNVYRYVKRFQARPAYLAAMSKGGDYEYGPQAEA